MDIFDLQDEVDLHGGTVAGRGSISRVRERTLGGNRECPCSAGRPTIRRWVAASCNRKRRGRRGKVGERAAFRASCAPRLPPASRGGAFPPGCSIDKA